MGKIKKLQDKGATILPLTVADAVLMNSTEAGNLSTYLESLKSGVDFLLSIIGEDQAGDIFLKTKDGMPRGFYTEGFVSAGGKSTPEGGGGTGGANLTQIWESLQGNNDTFKDRLINVAHIPTLTTGKISDFVSATQAIANTAVANKADKDKVVDLTSNQTISGAKTFSNLKVSNTNLVTNLNADMLDGKHASDFAKYSGSSEVDSVKYPSIGYGSSSNGAKGSGAIITAVRSSGDYGGQFNGDYNAQFLCYRGLKKGAWTAWKQLAFTDDVLLRTGGTLTGALTVNAPINNTGALKLLGASEVSSTGMAVGKEAKALGTQSRALARYSYAGLRTGDSTYPYASIKPYDLQPFTVNGNTVYGVPIPIGETVKYTYNNVEYSAENTTSTTQVLVLITAGADFKGGVVKPYNKCALTYSGASLSYGRHISGIKDLSGNVKAVIIYTWANSRDESGFISSFKISGSDKLYAFRGDTSSSGETAIAIGENSVANGKYSVVSGHESVASGSYSMASGYYSVASGSYSMAIGPHAIASGIASLASGYESIARGNYSAASGYRSVASGSHSKAFGQKAIADGSGAMAFGELSQAKASLSFVFAYSGISARVSQTVLGRYNEEDVNSLLVIGSGASDTARKNVFTVDSNGYVRMGNRLFIGVGGKNEVYFNSDVADQLYVHTSAGIPFLIQGDFIRRGSCAPTTTLGTDQYKWFNVFTEALKIADANLTYDIGTLTVDKALKTTSTLTATQGEFANHIKIGDATISWNPEGYLEINEGLASQKFISAGGVVTGDAGGGAGGIEESSTIAELQQRVAQLEAQLISLTNKE